MNALPDYEKPPVIEVAMGVQFAPLTEMTVGHVGLYWGRIRETFARVEEHPPIVHMLEGSKDPPEPGLSLRLMDKPELPRVWFLDASGARLLQVQRDRFLHNWRKVDPTDEYPRFQSVRDTFFRHWNGFREFLAENGLRPEPDQCELTYVNHIPQGDAWSTMPDLQKVFTSFAWRTRSGFLPAPDSAGWRFRFALPESMGRFHVDVLPARVPPSNDPVIRFSLTARGRPDGDITPESMGGWFAMAHEWIVRGFADLVDDRTDRIWEKRA